jgi:hypothetical protein
VANACFSLSTLGECFGTLLHGWITRVTPWLAPIGAVIAFCSKYLGDVAAAAKQSTGLMAWIKKIMAKGAIWLAAIIMPSFLWLLYLGLTSIGIAGMQESSAGSSATRLMNWFSWAGPMSAHVFTLRWP